MNKTFAWLLILALLAVSFISIARVSAQEDDHDDDSDVTDPDEIKSTPSTGTTTDADQDEVDEGDDGELQPQLYILPAVDVKTSVLFPEFPDKRFVQGEEVTILLGFHNTGSKNTYNITYVGGHLHSLIDFGYFIQNFSVREVGAIVAPGEQITVEYKVRPDPSLEPIEFLFSSWVFYNDSNDQIYRNVFTNSTVELLEKRSELDAKTLFQYLLFAAVVGLIGYTFVQVSASGKKLSRAVGRSTKGKTSAPATWDTQIYTPKPTAKAVAGSRGSRKASNKKDQSE